VQVEEQLGTGFVVPGIKGLTSTLIGKVRTARFGATVLLLRVIVGLTEVSLATEDEPPTGFVTVQL
jgi:hypothetical protein